MIRLFKNWYQRHFSQPGTIEFALVLLVAFLIVYYLMWLVGPIVVALCIAYILDWGVRYLVRRFSWQRKNAAIVITTLFVGTMVALCVYVVPLVIKQGAEFYNNIIAMSEQEAITFAKNEGMTEPRSMTINDFDWVITHEVYDVLETMPDPIPALISQETIKNSVTSMRIKALANMANIFRTQFMPSVFNLATWLIYIIIVPIFTFLMLRNKEILQKRVLTYVLPNNQNLIKQFWPSLNNQIEGYIRGKLIHIVIISIVNTLAFTILGVNYAVLLGIGVGLSVVIPYVGAILIGLPVFIVAILQFGICWTLFWVLFVYVVIQLLDSNVLTPMLFSKAMNLDAFSILAAILIFGGLWGFWGVFFSIPLATFIKTLLVKWPSLDPDVEGHRIKLN